MIIIKGAGDIASGVALRLHRAGIPLIMTDIDRPTAIRRTVSFCDAIACGNTEVEGVCARRAEDAVEALAIMQAGVIPVLADPSGECVRKLSPLAVVDAILAKRNLGTAISDAPIVIALGPGFCAGVDCHAVVETMRGHTLGRVILEGAALPNTASPGNIGGYTTERILRAPCEGTITQVLDIGAHVAASDTVAYVEGLPIKAEIGGILRGILKSGTQVYAGMKGGDIDPRCELSHCYTASDKALAVGGGVLEALLYFANKLDMKDALWKMK